MDIQEYISSGILELYASGALPDGEAREVERMAAEYPEVREELTSVTDAFANYAAAHRMNPRPELRMRVMESLDAGSQQSVPAPVQQIPQPQPAQPSNIVPLYSRMRYLAAASVTFALISGGTAAYFYGKWNNTDAELERITANTRTMADDYDRTKRTLDKLSSDVKMMRGDSMMTVAMHGMGPSPDARAQVYWDQRSGQVYLDIVKLQEATVDKQYQLWAIVDGKPMDAGVFDIDKDHNFTLVSMKPIPKNAKAFAVTMERRGGSPSPTMETMCLMGPVKI